MRAKPRRQAQASAGAFGASARRTLVTVALLAMASLLAAQQTPERSWARGHKFCQDCHVAHASGDTAPVSAGSTQTFLRGRTVLETCLRCHDGSAGAPDVVGSDINRLTDRAGGVFAAVGTLDHFGHVLGTPPADQPTRSTGVVTCTDCHDPHGNGQPRSLRRPGVPQSTTPVGLFVDPQATGLEQFEAGHVAYGADGAGTLEAVTNLCLDCHAEQAGVKAAGFGNGRYRKHPTADDTGQETAMVSQGDQRGSTNSTHWVRGTGTGFEVPRLRFLVTPASNYQDARAVSPSNQVFCLTCHKAHGSEHSSGLAWQANNDGSIGPAGCDQCHCKSGSEGQQFAAR